MELQHLTIDIKNWVGLYKPSQLPIMKFKVFITKDKKTLQGSKAYKAYGVAKNKQGQGKAKPKKR